MLVWVFWRSFLEPSCLGKLYSLEYAWLVAEVVHSRGRFERSYTAVFMSRDYSLMSCWPALAWRVFCLAVIMITCFKIPCYVIYVLFYWFLLSICFSRHWSLVSESQAFSFYMSFWLRRRKCGLSKASQLGLQQDLRTSNWAPFSIAI